MAQVPPDYLEQFAGAGAGEMEGMAQGQAPKKKPLSRYEAARQAQREDWNKRRANAAEAERQRKLKEQDAAYRAAHPEGEPGGAPKPDSSRYSGTYIDPRAGGASTGRYAAHEAAMRGRRSTGKYAHAERAMKEGRSTGRYAHTQQRGGGGGKGGGRRPMKRGGGGGMSRRGRSGLGGGGRVAARRAAASGFRV
jgi:hypothetical protein